MSQIADSDAIYDEDRLLAQHQAVLTLIQDILANPQLTEFHWLDLACGKGQIIANLQENLSVESRGKICYYGYDIEVNFIKNAERRTETLGLQKSDFQVGELSSFAKIYGDKICFNFITLTNTIHEVDPVNLSLLLFECIEHLCPDGCLFIYDMEKLPSLELGAVPWRKSEINEIIVTLLRAMGVNGYIPAAGQWRHKSCNGWNLQIRKAHMDISSEKLSKNKEFALTATVQKISEILERKFSECESSLEILTRFGSETDEENTSKLDLLYDYWALNQARGKIK